MANRPPEVLPVVLLLHRSPEVRRLVSRDLDHRVTLIEAENIEEARRLLASRSVNVVAFGSVKAGAVDRDDELLDFIREVARRYPQSRRVGCSSVEHVCHWLTKAGAEAPFIGQEHWWAVILAACHPEEPANPAS